MAIEVRRATVLHELLLLTVVNHHVNVLSAEHRELHSLLDEGALTFVLVHPVLAELDWFVGVLFLIH